MFKWYFQLNHTASSDLTEEQQQIYKLASDFANQEMKPHMAEWDEKVILFFILINSSL